MSEIEFAKIFRTGHCLHLKKFLPSLLFMANITFISLSMYLDAEIAQSRSWDARPEPGLPTRTLDAVMAGRSGVASTRKDWKLAIGFVHVDMACGYSDSSRGAVSPGKGCSVGPKATRRDHRPMNQRRVTARLAPREPQSATETRRSAGFWRLARLTARELPAGTDRRRGWRPVSNRPAPAAGCNLLEPKARRMRALSGQPMDASAFGIADPAHAGPNAGCTR